MTAVERHYTQGRLIERIEAGLRAAGKSPDQVSVDDLGPVDEFHIGGRAASLRFLGQLDLRPEQHALDIGSGLGGTARLAHARFGCRVSGIDLTAEFVETARVLSDWVGLSEPLVFECGTALETPFDDAQFDAAFQLHVGMNIADKAALFAEVRRVLRPGASFGIYDVMTKGEGALVFPVPWATRAEESAVATPEAYVEALVASDFEIVSQRDCGDDAAEFFQMMRARAENAEGPPPLGLHLVMGDETPTKVANMIANIEAGRVSPTEIIARRR